MSTRHDIRPTRHPAAVTALLTGALVAGAIMLVALVTMLVSPHAAEARAGRPAGPRLIAPQREAFSVSSNVTFRWSSRPPRSTVFELRVSRSPRFTAPTTFRALQPRYTASLARGTWYWRVRSAPTANAAARLRFSRWSSTRRMLIMPSTDTVAPTRPGPIRATLRGQSLVDISFDGSRDDVGLAAYEVLANDVVVAQLHSTSATLWLACGVRYRLAARAIDTSGNRSRSSALRITRTRPCIDNIAPNQPGSITAQDVTTSSALITWQSPAPASDGNTAAGYLVLRDGVVVGGSLTTHFVVTGMREDATHIVSVYARDRAGNTSLAPARLTVRTARPEQRTGAGRAWVLTSSPNSYAGMRTEYRALERVYPTFFGVGTDGSLLTQDRDSQYDERITPYAHARGVHVFPRIMTQTPSVIVSVLTDPAKRERLAVQAAAAANADGYDGIVIDMEVNAMAYPEPVRPQVRSGFTALIARMTDLMHRQGRTLSVAIAPNWCSLTSADAVKLPVFTIDWKDNQCASHPAAAPVTHARGRTIIYDVRSLARTADEVFVLAWGFHWSTSNPGDLVDAAWLSAVTRYTDDLLAHGDPNAVVPEERTDTSDIRAEVAHKFTIGAPLHGFDWAYRRPVNATTGAVDDTGVCLGAWWQDGLRTGTYLPITTPVLAGDPVDVAGALTADFTPWKIRRDLPQRKICLVRAARAIEFDPAHDAWHGNDPVLGAGGRPIGDPADIARPWGAAQLLTSWQLDGGAYAPPVRDPGSDELVAWHADGAAGITVGGTGGSIASGSNPIQRQLWFADAQTLRNRAAIIRAAGFRMGVWRLGAHDHAAAQIISEAGA